MFRNTGRQRVKVSPAQPAGRPWPSRPSPLPPALRWLGPFLAAGFGAGSALTRRAYDRGWAKSVRAAVPVLSVGNLTAGGTGKTPTVAYLARGLIQRGLARKPAVLMRGYGARRPGEANDEARELQKLLGEAAPILCNPNRELAAAQAVARDCDAIILDDGFQHRRLARDLDIVLIDATDPFGGGHYLPWGRLREPPEALARAQAVIITRADHAEPAELERLKETLKLLAPGAGLSLARQTPQVLRRICGPDGEAMLDELKGKKVLALCGIGNPDPFVEQLRRHGADIVAKLIYPDHAAYGPPDLERARTAAVAEGAEWIVTTGKDAVKLEDFGEAARSLPPLWALRIETELLQGDAALWRRIEQAVGGRRA